MVLFALALAHPVPVSLGALLVLVVVGMALTHRVGIVYSSDAGTIVNTTDVYTGDGEANFDGSAPAGVTEIDVAFPFALVKSMVFYATQALSIATNHASKTVSALTSSSTTAHATTSTAHGYTTGDKVVISGASPAAYNGTYEITVIDTDEFEYTFAGSGTSPATGTIKATKGDDVLELAAGKQLVWTTDHIEDNPLTADVAKIYAVNQGGTTAAVKIRALFDATP